MDNIKLTKTQQKIFDTIADLAKDDRDVRGFLCLPMSGKSRESLEEYKGVKRCVKYYAG